MLSNKTQPQDNQKQYKQRTKSDVYRDALLSEWILMSSYSPEDFHCKFEWPETRPGIGVSAHFAATA